MQITARKSEEKIKKLTTTIYSKLEKNLTTSGIVVPRTAKVAADRAALSYRNFVDSGKTQQLKTRGISIANSALARGSQIFKRVQLSIISSFKYMMPRIIGIKNVKVRELPVVKSIPRLAGNPKPIMSRSKLSAGTYVGKLFSYRVHLPTRQSAKSAAIIPSPKAELIPPMPGSTNQVVRALDDFSNLPLWLTMPMLFASSFVLGAIVSFLVR
jgi:hypothetical protein